MAIEAASSVCHAVVTSVQLCLMKSTTVHRAIASCVQPNALADTMKTVYVPVYIGVKIVVHTTSPRRNTVVLRGSVKFAKGGCLGFISAISDSRLRRE